MEFLLDAAKRLQGRPSKSDLKYATLHLVASVEILFKVRLEQEHWTLLFPKLGRRGKSSESELRRTGSLLTVDAFEAVAGCGTSSASICQR
jgi:hypothetical protein